jgi:hypothetical protein
MSRNNPDPFDKLPDWLGTSAILTLLALIIAGVLLLILRGC